MNDNPTTLPITRLLVDQAATLVLPTGERLPAEFRRESPAFSALDGQMHAPDELLTEQTPLGTALRVHAGSANLLDSALSQGQSLQGLTSGAPLALSEAVGITGPGIICWTPVQAGDILEIAIPAVDAASSIPGFKVGIFVGLCFSAYVKTDVGLTFEMANPVDPEFPRAQPQLMTPDPRHWQRGAVAVRLIKQDQCVLRLVARGSGTVYLDGLQLDPRPFVSWMIESREPMKSGWCGPWTPGGTRRAHDSLAIPLAPGALPAEGTVSAWFKPDWPTGNYPHTIFEVASDAFGLWLDGYRLIGAVGGTQVWPVTGLAWLHTMRIEQERWHHIALSWTAEGQVSLYLDGECYARRHTPPALRDDIANLPGPLCLGMPSDPQGFQELPALPSRLDGLLADFRIYHGRLDDKDIAALALAGFSILNAGAWAAPEHFSWLVPEKPELQLEKPYHCWLPTGLALFPDGSIMSRAGLDPDFAPVLTDYWKGQAALLTMKKDALADPWRPVDAMVLRPLVHLPDGRWLGLSPKQKTIVSTDGKHWDEVPQTIINPPEHAVVGNRLRQVDQWFVDSRGRILGIGIMRFEAAPHAEAQTTEEKLFGAAHGPTSHIFLAEVNPDDLSQVTLLSLITEAQTPLFGAVNEENQIVETVPGEFLLVGRMYGHNVPCYQLRSADGGQTWSKLETCPFGAVWPVLAKLENGLVVCHTGRPDTVLHWTADGGRTWSPPVTVVDSREVPLQSMNIWYGATGGYGSVIPVAPDRLLEIHDVLGAYNPATRARTNQCWTSEIAVHTLDHYAAQVSERIAADQFTFTGAWEGDTRLGLDGASCWTADPHAGAVLRFTGTGITLVHPLLRHGGKLQVTIDGQPAGSLSLYAALPHFRFARTVLATNLPAGPHTLELTPDLSGTDRHAHGDGTELGGINSWLYLAHVTPRRWAGVCLVEVLK